MLEEFLQIASLVCLRGEAYLSNVSALDDLSRNTGDVEAGLARHGVFPAGAVVRCSHAQRCGRRASLLKQGRFIVWEMNLTPFPPPFPRGSN